MIASVLQSLLKKKVAITAATAESLQRAPVLWQSFLPNLTHYRRYCELVGWHNDTLVHPFYWQVRALPLQLRLLAHPKSPFSLLGLVHLDNRVDEYAESRVDIPCELVARFGTIYQHRRGLAVEVVVTATQRGKRVYSATGTYLMRTTIKIPALPAYEPQRSELTDASEPMATYTLTGALVRRYAFISGDFNPIHLGLLGAKMFGFKRAIAHGMFTGAMAIASLDQHAPIRGERVEMRFLRPMMLPASATLSVQQSETTTVFGLHATEQRQAETYLTGTLG